VTFGKSLYTVTKRVVDLPKTGESSFELFEIELSIAVEVVLLKHSLEA
jgi:hypothetical protein